MDWGACPQSIFLIALARRQQTPVPRMMVLVLLERRRHLRMQHDRQTFRVQNTRVTALRIHEHLGSSRDFRRNQESERIVQLGKASVKM
jgi:hypothetical protein